VAAVQASAAIADIRILIAVRCVFALPTEEHFISFWALAIIRWLNSLTIHYARISSPI
jgi:hypothetical protein